MITLSPPSAQTPPPSDALRVGHDADSDPRIASLKGMFPDFDAAVILSVFESVDNDQDRALDILLGMNDPTYISSTVPPSTAPQQLGPTQEDLDEQLARRLALEEEQAARAWSADRQPGWRHPMSPSQDQQQAGYQTYQPRRGSGRGWGSSSWGSWSGAQGQTTQSQGQGGQRDTMAEFQEGFNKIAESGKKTFSTIVSRVKAKMQEFDQGSGFGSGSTTSTAHATPGHSNQVPLGSAVQDYTYSPPYGAGRTTDPSWSAGQPRTNTYAYAPVPAAPSVPPAGSRPDTHTRTPSPTAIQGYDISDHTDNTDPFGPPVPPSFPQENAIVASGAKQDVGATRASVSIELPTREVPGAFPTTPHGPAPVSPLSQGPSSDSGLGPVPISGLVQSQSSQVAAGPAPRSNVDFTKLGLLPKRPVSLVRPQSPPTTTTTGAGSGNNTRVQTKGENDDDELEYVENPFEDRH